MSKLLKSSILALMLILSACGTGADVSQMAQSVHLSRQQSEPPGTESASKISWSVSKQRQATPDKELASHTEEENDLSKPAIIRCIAACAREYERCVAANPGGSVWCNWAYDDCYEMCWT